MIYTSQDYPGDYDDPAASVAGQRSVALSNKLSAVLSVSYADSEIRDALRLLDLKNTQNTAGLRRSIRADLQKDVIESNSNIVQEFGQVAEQLKHVGSIISSLNACCEDVRRQVAAARQQNAPILEEASTLLKEKRDLDKKHQLLVAFKKHFVLPEDELTVLTSAGQAMNPDFFAVLDRTKQIHADCQVLLGSENQRLGLELMEQSSKQLNSGYQKLHSWVQLEFKALDLENPQLNASIRRALRTLAERPALFENCLDSFSEARKYILTDGFYNALTGSSAIQDRAMKPIEFHAHDALRYIGDILAWTHSTAVSERESLESLFISEGDEMAKGIRAGRQREPWSATDGESFDGRKALDGLVNRNMTGVARALRQRIEQAVQSQDDSVAVYKIANLIGFYRVTLTKLLGPDSSIMEALSALENVAMSHFGALQSDQTATAQAEFAQAPPDLSVPDVLEQTLQQVKALLKIYESSLTPNDSREEDFKPILLQTLKPMLDTCDSLAKQLDAPAADIFLINCYDSARSTLQPFDFTQWFADHIGETIMSATSNLIDYQHAFFLHVSGMHPLITALQPLTLSEGGDLLRVLHLAPLQPAALEEASQTLDEFLPSALIDASENLKQLKNTELAGHVTSKAADRFCGDFEFVETRLAAVDEMVSAKEGSGSDDEYDGEKEIRGGRDGVKVQQDEKQAWVSLKTFYPRTSGDIRVLLS
ncbi:MAG: hypothetical protein Q9169_000599 [Polycauliona sp. 2 TL-2023]